MYVQRQSELTKEIALYLYQGATPDDLYFWTGKREMPSDDLVLVTPEIIKQEKKSGNYYYLLFTHPELLYPSLRPITDMKEFDTGNYYSNEEDIPNNRIKVTRYTQGEGKGKYFTERPENICGYFFYYEPGSTTFLSYKTSYNSFNKLTCAQEFMDLVTDELRHELQEGMHSLFFEGLFYPQIMHSKGILPRDLKFTPLEAYNLLNIEGYNPDYRSNTRLYYGECISGAPHLDQVLCK